VIWRTTWHAKTGTYQLAVRAKDGTGEWQTPVIASSFPSGASGLHHISVSIASSS
jgi:hypothetical protein